MIAKPSIQSLFLEMQFDGSGISTGTGFVYSHGEAHFLVTNRHNVTGKHQETNELLSPNKPSPNQIKIVQNQKDKLGSWLPKTENLYDQDDNPLWYEHPTHGAKVDCVALPLTQLDDVHLYPYNEYDNSPKVLIGPADVVSVVGFPFGIMAGGACAVWATGFVASEPTIDLWDLPLMLIDCRGRPGQSGSPVMAYRAGGSVAMEDGSTAMFNGPISLPIGIYSGRVNAESDLGMVWKMKAVREIVEHAATSIGG